MDADGFIKVEGRTARRGWKRDDEDADAAGDGHDHADERRSPMDEEDHGMGEEDGVEGGDGGVDEVADAAELRRRFEAEAAFVRRMEREGVPPEHGAMRAAIAERDEAERRWRSAKGTHPLAKRLAWAQQRLDKAFAAQDRAREALAIHDSEARAKREAFVERLRQARERVSIHRERLETLQEEAAAEAPSVKRRGTGNETCALVSDGLLRQVAPEITALAETLPDGSEARARIDLLTSQLAAMQQDLAKAARGNGAREEFDIGLDDDQADEGISDGDDDCADGDESYDGGWQGPWRPRGHGRWSRDTGRSTSSGGANATETAGASSAAPGTAGLAAAGAGAAAAGAAEGAARQLHQVQQPPQHQQLRQGTRAAQSDRRDVDGDGQPSAKSRRAQTEEDTDEARRAEADAREGLRLMQQQAEVQAAGAFGSEQAAQGAGQIHAARVAAVVAKAIGQGVQPMSETGEDLIMLSPEELSKWVADNLTAAA